VNFSSEFYKFQSLIYLSKLPEASVFKLAEKQTEQTAA
jgi:hypothetical protein